VKLMLRAAPAHLNIASIAAKRATHAVPYSSAKAA